MKRCKCGSFAINHHAHGRDDFDKDLCDVCYWRKRAEDAQIAIEILNTQLVDMANIDSTPQENN